MRTVHCAKVGSPSLGRGLDFCNWDAGTIRRRGEVQSQPGDQDEEWVHGAFIPELKRSVVIIDEHTVSRLRPKVIAEAICGLQGALRLQETVWLQAVVCDNGGLYGN